MTQIKKGGERYIIKCQNFRNRKQTMVWFRFSVCKDVFFTGVEENENLKKYP